MWMIDKLATAGASLFRAANAEEFAQLDGLPGPTPTLPLGNAGDFMGRNPWEVLRDYGRDYGDLVRLWIFGEPALLPIAPQWTEAVLSRGLDFPKRDPIRALTPLLTPVEAFLANDPDWARVARRAPLGLPGVAEWVPSLSGPLRSATVAAWEQLPTEASDAITTMRRLSFDLFSVLAIGKTLPEAARKAFHRMADEGDERMTSVIPITEESWDLGFRHARTRFWDHFREAISAARRDGCPQSCMLSFVEGQSHDLSDDELAAALANLYFSGLFSTTSGWTTLLWQLGAHPDLRAELEVEARTLPEQWGYADARHSPALDRCVREALRWAPPVPVYLRNVATDHPVELAGHTLPPGAQVLICNYAVHHQDRYWADAGTFDPSRWTDAVRASTPYGSGTFWPFGRGARACSGGDIALAILHVGTTELLRLGLPHIHVDGAVKWSPYFACMSLENGRLHRP